MLSRNYEVGSMGVDAGLYMYDVVVKKFTFTISSPDEFLVIVPIANLKGPYFQPSLCVCLCVCL